MLLPFLAFTMASLVQCQVEIQPACLQQPTSSMHVGVKTLRSQRGNWVTKVEIGRPGGRSHVDASTGESWTVDVDANTTTCEGRESTLNVVLTLTDEGTLIENSTEAEKTSDVASPQKETAVPKGYELFPGIGMYKFHSEVANWTSARQVCAEEGAHLVIFNSEKENDVIRTIFARYPTMTGATSNDHAWVGIQQIGKEHFTVFGDRLASTGFERWDSSEPEGGKQDCILTQRVTGALADVTCDWKVAFICEHPL